MNEKLKKELYLEIRSYLNRKNAYFCLIFLLHMESPLYNKILENKDEQYFY